MTADPDRLARLEEERRFLLTSIGDLERERSVGDVDETDYLVLRDGYVARAAAVVREIESGRRALAAHRPVSWPRRLLVPVLTLAVAATLGIAVARSAGQRLPGQTVTGGLPLDEVATLLAEARTQFATDPAAAIAAYDRVLVLEPENVEAVTYRAWLVILGARGAGDSGLVTAQLDELRRAVDLDPTYPDPHCFLAVAAGSILEPPQVDVAQAEGQRCLELEPPGALVPGIEQLLARLGG